jgi:hypothetical protein
VNSQSTGWFQFVEAQHCEHLAPGQWQQFAPHLHSLSYTLKTSATNMPATLADTMIAFVPRAVTAGSLAAGSGVAAAAATDTLTHGQPGCDITSNA